MKTITRLPRNERRVLQMMVASLGFCYLEPKLLSFHQTTQTYARYQCQRQRGLSHADALYWVLYC